MDETGFFERVWDVVARIPEGRVTTYGHIAEHLNVADARAVGWALKAATGRGLPCHRVVSQSGNVSGRPTPGGAMLREELLRSEQVTFVQNGRVDLARHLWLPGTREVNDLS